MFDPFNDFETAGYLRNYKKFKDPEKVKYAEHVFFESNLSEAIDYLESLDFISYSDFLKVHEILFSEMYPWAGKDRTVTAPELAIGKSGNFIFSHPEASKIAINHGLYLANDPVQMKSKLGTIMGHFAYGHPFLDGNGRTMLVVHTVLANRAGFSIDWHKTNKTDYLHHLTDELENPEKGILDQYLTKYISDKVDLTEWSKSIVSLPGLDGMDTLVEGDFDDPEIKDRYEKQNLNRGYEYEINESHKKIKPN